jgi:prolyl oligopeptidase
MKPILALPATLLFVFAATAAAAAYKYPETKTVDRKDDDHGTLVADPYRWLEDDVRESEAVADWVERQNALTFDYLDGLAARERIQQRLTELWNFERYSVPLLRGRHYYFRRNDGLQDQSVVYRTEALGGERQIVLDPNDWSEDGTVALGEFEVSGSGRYVAYSIQDGGTDWRIWRVRDMDQVGDLEEELRWIKFSIPAWAADQSGFYYSRYPQPAAGEEFQGLNQNHAVYFHRLGTPQSDDRLVHARPDHPDWNFAPTTTGDGRFLILTSSVGTDDRYRLEYLDLSKPDAEVVVIEDEFEAAYHFIEMVGTEAYFRSTREAPRGRILKIDLANPNSKGWQEVVPEGELVLENASMVGDRLILGYLQDARSRVVVHGLDGSFLRDVALPGLGTAEGFPSDPASRATHYAYSSFNQPATIYRYDLDSGKSTAVLAPEVPFDPEDYVVKQVFFSSRDGTRVPMFIAHRRGITPHGDNPTLLYGYGGFNISLTPRFSVTRLAWMEMGGVYAVANLRGGGEYGEVWHKAGTRLNKQNVFDDFIAAAEHLIELKYTRPDRLAAMGGSNGGLLVGAVINQRPDLFAAALPAVGVMDMLRFQRFTAGRYWVDDYGSSDDPEEFRALYAYSPYHNIRDGVDYPATLVTTADTDDRVVPGHSFKYIARLQQAHKGEDPVMIRIQTRAGHGAGMPTSMRIREYADMWAFLARHLGMEAATAGSRAAALAYRCEHLDTPLQVAFILGGEPRVSLQWGDRREVLPRVRSASGAKYQAPEDRGGMLFWSKGDEAMFITDDGDSMTCRRVSGG